MNLGPLGHTTPGWGTRILESPEIWRPMEIITLETDPVSSRVLGPPGDH